MVELSCMGEVEISYDAGSGERKRAGKVRALEVSGLGNANLSPDRMRELKERYEKELGIELYPVIVAGAMKGQSRFYLVKPITLGDINEYDELISIFQEEEVKQAKELARKKWFMKQGLDFDKPKKLTDDQAADLEKFIEDFLQASSRSVVKKVTDKAACCIGVVFPENIREHLLKLGYGDISLVASAIHVASGWSELSLDIESFEEAQKLDVSSIDDADLYSAFKEE